MPFDMIVQPQSYWSYIQYSFNMFECPFNHIFIIIISYNLFRRIFCIVVNQRISYISLAIQVFVFLMPAIISNFKFNAISKFSKDNIPLSIIIEDIFFPLNSKAISLKISIPERFP